MYCFQFTFMTGPFAAQSPAIIIAKLILFKLTLWTRISEGAFAAQSLAKDPHQTCCFQIDVSEAHFGLPFRAWIAHKKPIQNCCFQIDASEKLSQCAHLQHNPPQESSPEWSSHILAGGKPTVWHGCSCFLSWVLCCFSFIWPSQLTRCCSDIVWCGSRAFVQILVWNVVLSFMFIFLLTSVDAHFVLNEYVE